MPVECSLFSKECFRFRRNLICGAKRTVYMFGEKGWWEWWEGAGGAVKIIDERIHSRQSSQAAH